MAHSGERSSQVRALGMKQALRASVVLAAVIVATLLLREIRVAAEAWTAEPRHAAAVMGTADDGRLELEVERSMLETSWAGLSVRTDVSASASDRVRVIVPRPTYLWAGMRDEVGLVRDPDDPARWHLLDPLAMTWRGVGWLALLAVLGGLWLVLGRLRWGEDLIFDGRTWRPSSGSALRPGQRAAPSAVLRPPASQRRFSWRGPLFLAAGTLVAGALVVANWAEAPLELGVVMGLVLAVAAVLLHGRIRDATGYLTWDDEGVADLDAFGARRIPWAAIATFEWLNLAAEEQRRYDARLIHHSRIETGRQRPGYRWVWRAAAADGTVLFDIDEDTADEPSFDDLSRRIALRLRPQASARQAPDDDPDDGEDAEPGSPAAR